MDRIEPGNLITATGLSTPLAQCALDLNSVRPEHVRYKSLGPLQCPSQLVGAKYLCLQHVVRDYPDVRYPGYNILVGPSGWARINTNGGGGGGTYLEVDFGATLSLGALAGVFLEASFEIVACYEIAPGPLNANYAVFFALDAYDGAVWIRVVETETWTRPYGLTATKFVYDPHGIKFLLTRNNKNGIASVRKIRAVTCTCGSPAAVNASLLQLNNVSLGAVALRGGVF